MAEPRTPQNKIDDQSADLVDVDHRRLARVQRSLDRARALRQWWQAKNQTWVNEFDGEQLARVVDSRIHPACFHLTRALPLWAETEANWGFFDEAPIDGRNRPIMGLFQQTLFDEPRQYFAQLDRTAQLDRWQEDLRAFVLQYLIRLTGFYESAPYVDPNRRPVGSWLRFISWCASPEDRRGGFGFSQVYYQRSGSGLVGKFREVDRSKVDLRTLDGEFDWIVIGIRINDLHLRHPAVNWLSLSIHDEVLAVLSRDFVVCDDHPPQPGVRGRFGFGYAVLEDPPEEGPAVVWRRPRFGFQLNEFAVQDTGRVLARSAMVTDKLSHLMAFNPVEWGRTVADRASLGTFSPAMDVGLRMLEAATPGLLHPLAELAGVTSFAGRFDPFGVFAAFANSVPLDVVSQLCLSPDDVLRSLLSDFVRSQLSTIIASRGVWRAVPDWTHADRIPDWVPSA